MLTGDITQSGFEISDWGKPLMPAGWYVVKNSNTNGVDASCNTEIKATGDQGTIHIILADGAEMTVNSGGNYGFNLGTYPLAIYGQSAGTGRLTVSSIFDAIYSNVGITINGGIVSATCGGNNVAIYSSEVTINGGQVTATGGGNHEGIHGGSGITLGCRKLTDFIKSNGFNGSVTIKSGQTLYDGTTAYSGNNVSLPSSGTVTLRPFSSDDLAVSDDGTEYTIKTAAGWGLFCDMLADGETFSGKTVNLDANIGTTQDPITRWAGSSGHEFQGTFDGGGNTLTVDYSSNSYADTAAPFSYVSGATIQNLVVAGNCGGTYGRAAGIVGESASMTAITNCISSVTISGGPFNGGISIGGLVDIEGCIYNGRINTTDRGGGFVGFAMSTTRIANSLFDPQEGSTIVGGTFYHISNTATITNSFYTAALGTEQGKAPRTVTAGTNVTISNVALTGTATTYDVSGITAYTGGGLQHGQTLYYGNEDEVSLTLSHTEREGYSCTYTASGGTLAGNDTDGYTLTMPDNNVTIRATYTKLPVITSYVDADGTLHENIEAIPLDASMTSLSAGWYVVNSNISYTSRITPYDDVHLILADGCTLTMGNSVTRRNDWGIYNVNANLTIYGQTQGTGALSIYTSGSGYYGICTKALTINGGHITVDTNGYNAHALVASNGDITINGGNVSANATGSTANALHAHTGKYYFNWRSPADRITIGATGLFTGYGQTVTFTKDMIDGLGNWYRCSEQRIYTSTGSIAANLTTINDIVTANNGLTLYPYVEALDLTANAHDGNYWTTFYCSHTNYKIKSDENAIAYTAHYDAANSQLVLHSLGKLVPKNCAVIIVADNNEVSMTAVYPNDTDAFDAAVAAVTTADPDAISGNNLRGEDVRTACADISKNSTFYVMGKQNDKFGFFQYTAQYMPARKAYLLVPGSNAAPGLKMVFDETSSLNEELRMKNEEFATAEWYDLSGRKLDKQPTQKGIYIVNGKKVVIK